MDFLIGGLAAVSAGFFTNPLEVLKIRLQLQGELSAKGHHTVHYKNLFHAGYVVAKNDGILALQNGLVPALWVQLIMNGSRLGFCQYAEDLGFTTNKKGETVLYKRFLMTGAGGMIGQFCASPWFLIKTHMQSKAAEAVAVGHQHTYSEGMWKSLYNIFKNKGMKGLFHGCVGSLPRGFFGSASQLVSFQYTKEWLMTFDSLKRYPILNLFLASMVGGVCISFVMTPFDLISTRLYNQPVGSNGKGVLYKSYIDCVLKIYKIEGILAFYKGVGPMYIRLGPHTVLCLTFWDIYKDWYRTYIVPPNKLQ